MSAIPSTEVRLNIWWWQTYIMCAGPWPLPNLRMNAYNVEGYTNAHLLSPPCQFEHNPYFHHALSSPIACLPPPLCQFKRNCSSPTSTVSSQALTLVFYHHQVNLSLNAHCLPPPCVSEHKCLSPTPNISIQAWMLVVCLHHVYLSANACLPPPMYPFKPEHLSSTSTMSIWAKCSSATSTVSSRAWMLVSIQTRMLVVCLHHVYSSIWHLSPTSIVTIWAWMLLICLHHAYLSTNTCLPPPTCLFEPACSSPTFTVSIQAWMLIICLCCLFKLGFCMGNTVGPKVITIPAPLNTIPETGMGTHWPVNLMVYSKHWVVEQNTAGTPALQEWSLCTDSFNHCKLCISIAIFAFHPKGMDWRQRKLVVGEMEKLLSLWKGLFHCCWHCYWVVNSRWIPFMRYAPGQER